MGLQRLEFGLVTTYVMVLSAVCSTRNVVPLPNDYNSDFKPDSKSYVRFDFWRLPPLARSSTAK